MMSEIMRRLGLAIAVAGLMAGVAERADAGPVTVLNPSFETPSLAPGAYTTQGEIPDWVGDVYTGVFHPESAQFPAGVPDGVNTAYSNGGAIRQDVGATLTLGTLYTLQVDVGERLDLGTQGYTIGLYAGGVLLASDDSSLTLVPGTFTTSTVTYLATGASPGLGSALEIQLFSKGVQGEFDNVRLDATATAVPEPSTLISGGLACLAGVGYSLRRRKAKATA